MRIALLCLAVPLAALAQSTVVDWKAAQSETLTHFRKLVQIDSSNPPGNETRVVDYLKSVFAKDGIASEVFALEPDRANLVARLKGNGKKRPILLLAHTDVVRVQRDKWPVDPFGAVLQDGFIWGRGSTDDKDQLAANLMVILLLKRSGIILDRDLIFLAEAGEESSTRIGIDFMVGAHFDAINAEFAVTEGGDVILESGRAPVIRIATTEKLPRRVRLVATGTSGHGSIPRTDNAVAHLAVAVARISAWETPLRLNETTRAYFGRMASIAPDRAAVYSGLLDPSHPMSIERELASSEPFHYSMLRTSVVPTMLTAGIGASVIPSEAEATIDIRMAPGEDPDRFFTEMARVIDDPAVKIVPVTVSLRPAGPPSGIDTDMFRALEAVSSRTYPGAATLPYMVTGASDLAQLRARGIQSYGIGPETTAEEFRLHGPHSDVERIAPQSLHKLAEFTWQVVMEVATARR